MGLLNLEGGTEMGAWASFHWDENGVRSEKTLLGFFLIMLGNSSYIWRDEKTDSVMAEMSS